MIKLPVVPRKLTPSAQIDLPFSGKNAVIKKHSTVGQMTNRFLMVGESIPLRRKCLMLSSQRFGGSFLPVDEESELSADLDRLGVLSSQSNAASRDK